MSLWLADLGIELLILFHFWNTAMHFWNTTMQIWLRTFEYLLQIIPAPPRLGEDEPPPSWDLVPSPRGDSILS
jgi:hypothetical protein